MRQATTGMLASDETAAVAPPGTRAAAPRGGAVLLGLVFVGFISLGLPDGLLGVAWPSVRRTFGLPLDALGPLFITTAGGYLAASLGSGWIVARVGVGYLLALSGLATAVGLLGYALAPTWGVVVLLGVLAGLGAGAIDAGLNAYVALHHSARLLNWLHASYGLGAAAGPAVMMAVLDGGRPWQLGYALVGCLQLGLGICFGLTARRWPRAGESREGTPDAALTGHPERRGGAVVWLSIALFFIYTGLETSAGQWAYTLFTESRQSASAVAGLWVSIYWGSLAFGRLLFGCVTERVSAVVLLRGSMLAVLSGAAFIWANVSEGLSFVGLGLMGLGAAPIFPSLIAHTPRRLGAAAAASVIGFQVGAASLGIAVLPALAGVLAERLGLEFVAPFLVLTALAMLLLHEAIVARRP